MQGQVVGGCRLKQISLSSNDHPLIWNFSSPYGYSLLKMMRKRARGGEDNPVDEVGGGVWPGVKGHAVSTGTDTNAQRAWRDQRFGGSSSTQDHFLPSSPLLLWAEGNETYFYVHHRLHGRHSGGPLQTWGWCLFNSHLFGRNRLELRLKSQLTLEVKFQFASKPVKELWQVKPPTPQKPKGFTAFPWLLGSVVVTGFGSDASSYYGDLGPWSKAGSVSPRLLWQLCDRSLLFEGVDERQDASLHTGRHPAGYRVAGRQRTAGLLGGRSSHQTLLIPQL